LLSDIQAEIAIAQQEITRLQTELDALREGLPAGTYYCESFWLVEKHPPLTEHLFLEGGVPKIYTFFGFLYLDDPDTPIWVVVCTVSTPLQNALEFLCYRPVMESSFTRVGAA
jgi:hypothetical protein